MNGAPSQVDTFDPKPALTKYQRHALQGDREQSARTAGPSAIMQSPFEFQQHGQSGLEISSLFPHTAKFADDLCVIRSLYTDTAAHASGCLQMNTGSVLIGKPSLGSWLSYGLGTARRILPSFVVMTDPRGGPIGSASNWTAGYMPAAYQGTLFRSAGVPLLDLATPAGTSATARSASSLDLLEQLNRRASRAAIRRIPSWLARINSYELAYRMQTTAAEVVDLEREESADPGDVRPESEADRRLRPQVPDHAPAAGEGRALRPALLRRRPHRGHLGRPQRLHHATTSFTPAKPTSPSPR